MYVTYCKLTVLNFMVKGFESKLFSTLINEAIYNAVKRLIYNCFSDTFEYSKAQMPNLHIEHRAQK